MGLSVELLEYPHNMAADFQTQDNDPRVGEHARRKPQCLIKAIFEVVSLLPPHSICQSESLSEGHSQEERNEALILKGGISKTLSIYLRTTTKPTGDRQSREGRYGMLVEGGLSARTDTWRTPR